MEPEVVKAERRGRKKKRKVGQGSDKPGKKTAAETRAKVLVGMYVKKVFGWSGVFIGKIVSYDTGLYRVDYEDGDFEDLESGEVKALIVGHKEMDDDFHKRKKLLDEHVLKKYAKVETTLSKVTANKVENPRSDKGGLSLGVELANADKDELSIRGGSFELSGAQPEVDDGSSSDFSDYEQPSVLVEVVRPSVPPPQLPPSSGNFGVSEQHVASLLSVYSFLRSFSVCLFLSPFGLDEFVGALNSSVSNTLLDAIHVALMRALKSHVETLSSEGSELASKCIRSMDWSLLDSLTWPVFIVQYLMIMRYAEGPEWKEFYVNVLEKNYYTVSAGRKLIVLQLLCDDALDSAEVRAEIDMREDWEVGPDPDVVLAFADESITRRVHDVSENHTRMPFSTIKSHVAKPSGSYTGASVDEDGNGDECRLCGMDGTLLCCDGCPSAYHTRCIGVAKLSIPEGAWYCPECTINKIGPNVTRITSLRGAEFFGIDAYEQVFLGSCDHLLVMKASSSDVHIRYYSPVDILQVLHALTDLPEHRALYVDICKGILRYWEIPEHIFSPADLIVIDEMLPNKTVEGDSSTASTLLAKESSYAQDVMDTGNINGFDESNLKGSVVAWHEEKCNDHGYDQASLDELKKSPHPQVVEDGTQPGECTISGGANAETACSVSASLHPSSELNKQCLSGRLSMKSSAECIPENGNCNNRSDMTGTQGHLIFADGCLYMGSSFKPQAYLNVYIYGDFAASAAAGLAILSSEEKLASQPQASSNHRKIMSANYSLQTKAFSLAAKRFYWPNYEKKLFEVPRERCGWCLSCKATVSSKRGCLLNAAASNAIKGAAKILTSMRQSKNVEGSLASIATYILFMEESLCGLITGPFLSTSYRNQWHKQVDEAATLGEIKAFLLDFEKNIRDIAFSADWIKLVDDMGLENQVTQSLKSVVGSTQKRGPGRRGRKPLIVTEVPDADRNDLSPDFAWWRGGMLSKHIIQKGILPRMMIKNAARQGGFGKINGVQYADGLVVPKRSRQFLWRAAVEMCKTASQLALQVRYLDLHVRWSELARPEQPIQDGKGSETEVSAFRNASIVDKKVVGNKISYGVVFGNQKHLPSRVLKSILEVEVHVNGKQKNWFLETRIPLYLIKEYEIDVAKSIVSTADKHAPTLPILQKKHVKAFGKNIFSFLLTKRENMGNCICTLCQLDVPFRIAARCSACQGYCHEQCAVSSNLQVEEHVEQLFTCKRCYQVKVVTPQNEIVGDSPTSPLLLQGQESQHPATVNKAGKQNCYEKPSEYSNQPSQKNPRTKNKKGKSRPCDSMDSSSRKKPTTDNSQRVLKKSTKKSGAKLTLGLIWKKKTPEDTGIDFRLKNLLLKGNPNGHLLAPKCQLCSNPYNSDYTYIRCEKCEEWFHGDAVELEESKIMELMGFKCCRCRRIRIPICPYTDPETRMKLEAKKKPQFRNQKQTSLESASNSEANDDQFNDEDVNVPEDDPLYGFPWADPANDQNHEVDIESGPKKLPVRRHMKPEKEPVEFSADEIAFDMPITTHVGNIPESSPIVEWDVPTNGFEDEMMFDFSYDDMEFEPQTYFSVNELLASDDDRGDQIPIPIPITNNDNDYDNANDNNNNNNPCGEYQMGISYDEQEPMFSVEAALDMMPCRVCSQTEPCPDLCCEMCGLWIHQHCSPWDEESSWDPETGWKCGRCRECR